MMKNPRNLLIFAILGGIVGTGLGFTLGRFAAVETPNEEAAAEMTAVLTAQLKAWNEGDIEAYMQGYQKSDQLRFASGGNVTTGWNETLTRYQSRYDSREKMGTLQFDIKSVDVLDADDGLVFGAWTLIRNGDRPSGLFTLHMKKGSDGWKVVSDHTSSTAN